jgi:biopolymer transport protein ExbB/TolQ
MLTQLLLKLTYLGAEWILWLLVALSVLSIALMLERWFYYWRTGVDATELGEQLQERMRKGDLAGAWQLVKEQHNSSIECGVVAAGLVNLRYGLASASEAMLSAKSRMRPALDANLSILATIGSNAPFVGLLGTVLGIIKAAHEMNVAAGGHDPARVMSGVFEALVATAVGLFVAIPAVVAYNLFERKVRTRLAAVDSLAHLVLANASADQSTEPAAPASTTRTH